VILSQGFAKIGEDEASPLKGTPVNDDGSLFPVTAERGLYLDREMVGEVLDRLDVKHAVDEDGDVLAYWDDVRLYFMFREEGEERIFSLRTFYDRRYEADERARLVGTVDDWNRRTFWPKVHTHAFPDGTLSCVGEIFLYAGFGVTAAHFEHSLKRWIAASLDFDEHLQEKAGPGTPGVC